MFWLRYTAPFLNPLRKSLNRSQFVTLLAAVAGFTTGLVATLLKLLVHYIQQAVSSFNTVGWAYAAFPMLGIFITVWIVQRFFGGKLERGVPLVLLSVAQRSSFISRIHTYLHVLTSGITVGFGGSAGLEAPIVTTGAAIGSNFAKIFRLNYAERTLLLASGAAGGIGAAFNAPIAGVMFAIEVLLPNATASHFIPILIAGASGAICSKMTLDEGILFNFTLREGLAFIHIPFFVLLGVLSGFMSVYYVRVTHFVESFFSRFQRFPYLRAVLGGVFLLVLCLFIPPLFSEGYASIKLLANGEAYQLLQHPVFPDLPENDQTLLLLLGAVLLTKVWATSTTLASGGNGGNFAPSLFVGAYLGFLFARIANYFKIQHLPEENFAVVGMAGILSGVMHAPLTAIFLIAEITGGYVLFVPLMIVSSISLLIARHFERYAMDTKRLATEGVIFTADQDRNVLTQLKLIKLIEKDIMTVRPEGTLNDLVETIRKSKRNLFAVVDKDERFHGVISLDDVKDVIFEREAYEWLVIEDVMMQPPATLDVQDDMEGVMKKFEATQAWNLPVLDGSKYIGMVSKSGIFGKYRQALAEQKEVL